jgi:hypothetical protein
MLKVKPPGLEYGPGELDIISLFFFGDWSSSLVQGNWVCWLGLGQGVIWDGIVWRVI